MIMIMLWKGKINLIIINPFSLISLMKYESFLIILITTGAYDKEDKLMNIYIAFSKKLNN